MKGRKRKRKKKGKDFVDSVFVDFVMKSSIFFLLLFHFFQMRTHISEANLRDSEKKIFGREREKRGRGEKKMEYFFLLNIHPFSLRQNIHHHHHHRTKLQNGKWRNRMNLIIISLVKMQNSDQNQCVRLKFNVWYRLIYAKWLRIMQYDIFTKKSCP